MEYYINAWLDCSEPKLEIIDKCTNAKILAFSKPQISQLIESGDLDLKDLCCSERNQEIKVIKELLSLFFIKKLRQDLQKLQHTMSFRRSENVVSLFST